MALPELINSSAVFPQANSLGGSGGPRSVYYNGSVYTVLFDNTTARRPTVFRTTSPGSGSWTELDASNRPTTTSSTASNNCMCEIVSSGSYLYVVTWALFGDANYGLSEFHSFDMSTEAWSTTNQTIANTSGMNVPNVDGGDIFGLFLRNVSGSELVVVGPGSSDSDMGTNYERVDIWRKSLAEGTTTWTGPVSMYAVTAALNEYWYNGAVLPNGTDIAFLWKSTVQTTTGSAYRISNFLSDNSVNYATSVAVPSGSLQTPYQRGMAFTHASNDYVAFIGRSGSPFYAEWYRYDVNSSGLRSVISSTFTYGSSTAGSWRVPPMWHDTTNEEVWFLINYDGSTGDGWELLREDFNGGDDIVIEAGLVSPGGANTATGNVYTDASDAKILGVTSLGNLDTTNNIYYSEYTIEVGGQKIAGADHLHLADAVSLTGKHNVKVAEATHVHAADNVNVGSPPISVLVADGTHLHVADNVKTLHQHIVPIARADHLHFADRVSYFVKYFVPVVQTTHLHTATKAAVTLGAINYSVQIAESAHVHTADSLTITSKHAVKITEAAHQHFADRVAYFLKYFVPVVEIAHVHTATKAAVTANSINYSVQIAEAVHLHTVNKDNVVHAHVARAADSAHTHVAKAPFTDEFNHLRPIADIAVNGWRGVGL